MISFKKLKIAKKIIYQKKNMTVLKSEKISKMLKKKFKIILS